MSIVLEKANWKAPNNVHAVTSTIHGGVSRGVYKSLNLGDHVDDEFDLVRKNRALILEHLNLSRGPLWLNQVHGIDVVCAEQALLNEGSSPVITADGSYSFKPGVVCAVLTADCMPLFLSTKEGDRVALVHAGWRGLADGIIEQGVQALNCTTEQIVAWAGPCIGPDYFEIGDEVRQQLGGQDSAYIYSENSTPEKTKWFANLYQLAGERLAKVGVDHYSHSQVCTYKDQNYFSYRRSGQCGRMASFIWFD